MYVATLLVADIVGDMHLVVCVWVQMSHSDQSFVCIHHVLYYVLIANVQCQSKYNCTYHWLCISRGYSMCSINHTVDPH